MVIINNGFPSQMDLKVESISDVYSEGEINANEGRSLPCRRH